MINLCNTNAYSFDENGDQPSKRNPRPVEDIEIIGIIRSDETIDMSTASSCGLSGIGAITLQFDTNDRTLTIQGNGSILDTSNPRQPDDSELTKLTNSNPLRVEHGWYTINPKYSIGSITCNSKLKISNIGLNNNGVNASNTEINNAAYANGIINSNQLNILNNSYFYGTSITCSGATISANSKCDTTSLSLNYFELNSSSLADSNVETAYFRAHQSKLIDCNIDTGACLFTLMTIQSNISQNTNNTNGTNEQMEFQNCTINNQSNMTINNLELLNTTINGTLQVEVLKTEPNSMILSSGTVNVSVFSGGIINYGKLYIDNVTGITTPSVINRSGLVELALTGTINLINGLGGTTVITQGAILLQSQNSGILKGESVFLSGSTNYASGRILCNIANLYGSQNFGYISTANFYQDGSNTNIGIVNNGNFYDNTINNGAVSTATFYNTSENLSSNIQKSLFLGASSNKSNLVGAIFKETSNNYSAGNLYEFYDKSIHHYGSLSGAKFYNSGQCVASSPLINTNFYDNSYAHSFILNGSGSIAAFYNTSSGNSITINSGIVQLYNNSSINTIQHSASPAYTGINVFLYENTTVKNLNANAALFDNASCENSTKILVLNDTSKAVGGSYETIYANNNSSVSGFVDQLFLSDNSQFLFTNLRNAVVSQDAQLIGTNNTVSAMSVVFSGGSKSITKSIVATNKIKFYDQSQNISRCELNGDSLFVESENNGTILKDSVFENQSRNNGTTTQNAYYIYESTNVGTGSISFFGSGCTNYGYTNIGYFYKGSSNLGTVRIGYFNEDVTNTGTVIISGLKTPDWHILNPPFSSADPIF